MKTNFEKVKDLIAQSNLSLPDQIDLIDLFLKANDSELESVADLFLSDSSWIEKINVNYKAKQAIFRAGDSKTWKQILETEEKELGNVNE
ncbi:MAG: hypothetical protein AAB837_00500 [Patescibacteria group bacterium]